MNGVAGRVVARLGSARFGLVRLGANQTKPAHRAEPARSIVEPEALEPSRPPEPNQAEPDAPDPNRRGLAYWIEELSGIVPLAAPLVLEAWIHARFAQHFLDVPVWLAWLLPASLGLGGVRTAFYLDRARLRGDPTGLIRFGLYGYMAAGFAVSYWFLTTVPVGGATKVANDAEVPAVVAGLFQAAGVFLWELRVRQRRREVERARHEVDEDRMRRTVMFPIWARRMRRWQVATGQRDMRVVVEAFAPLMVARLAGLPSARYPELAKPNRTKPRPEPEAPAEPNRAEPPQAKPARVVRIGSVRTNDGPLLARLADEYPHTKPVPTRREIEDFLDVGSTVAGRLRTKLQTSREPSQTEPEEPTG